MNATATPLRVAIFASVSSPPQATVDKDSLPAQIRDGRAFAAGLGARVAATYQVPGHTREYIFYTDAEADLDAHGFAPSVPLRFVGVTFADSGHKIRIRIGQRASCFRVTFDTRNG